MSRSKQPASNLDQLRARITELQARHAELSTHVRSAREARATINDGLTRAGLVAESRLSHHVAALPYGGSIDRAFVVNPLPGGAIDLGPLLAFLLGPDVLAARLEALAADLPEGLDTPARLAELARVGAELDETEAAEEALICRLEAAGEAVMRRGDARPEIVLALPPTAP